MNGDKLNRPADRGRVEACLRALPGVRDVTVVSLRLRGVSESIACVVPEGDGASAASLLNALPAGLAPRYCHVLERIPRTADGAVDQLQLMRSVPLHALKPVEDAPADGLARCWAEAVGSPVSDPDTGFLQAGGHSLAAIRLTGAIQRRWGVRVPLARLLRDDISLNALRRLLPAGAARGRTGVPRRSDPTRAPLLPEQRRLWLTQLIFPESSAYNVVGVLDCRGAVGTAALEKAWHALVAAYEVLRTTVEDDGGDLHQRIHDVARAPRDTFRHRTVASPGERWTERVKAFTAELADVHFDPGLLPRATLGVLTEEGGDRFALVLVMDHLVSDMGALDLMWDALAEYYATPEDVACPPQYGDLVAAMEQDPQQQARALAHWRTTLVDAPTQLPLPHQAPRPAHPTFRGASVTEELAADASQQVRRLARERRVGPTVPMLACYALVLSRWAQQCDLVVGLPVSGREDEESVDTVGFFMRTVPVRLWIPFGVGADHLVEQVADRLLSAVEHATVPFDEIVTAVGAPRDPTRNPLFQVWFNDVTQAARRTSFGGHRAEPLTPDTRWSLFDLGLYVHRTPQDTYRLELVYATDLWQETTARAFLDHCVAEMRSLVRLP